LIEISHRPVTESSYGTAAARLIGRGRAEHLVDLGVRAATDLARNRWR